MREISNKTTSFYKSSKIDPTFVFDENGDENYYLYDSLGTNFATLIKNLKKNAVVIFISLILISCNFENPLDPKVDELHNQVLSSQDSLENVISELRLNIATLNADTSEAHTLLKKYETLKDKYKVLEREIANLNPDAKTYQDNLKKIKDKSKDLGNDFGKLNQDNSKFKILTQDVKEKDIANENLQAENQNLKTKNESAIQQLKNEFTASIDSLTTALKNAQIALGSSTTKSDSVINEIAKIKTILTKAQLDLDRIPDFKPTFDLEYIPHFTSGFLKPKSVQIATQSRIAKRNLGKVRININANNVKDGANEIIVYISYVVIFKRNNKTVTNTLQEKLTTIKGEPITFSDSLIVKPNQMSYKDFDIYDLKLPEAEHIIKIYYKTSDLSHPQQKAFSTF